MYHDVVAAGDEDSSGFPGRDAALYKVTPELFEHHLHAIKRSAPVPPDRPDSPDPPELAGPPTFPAPPALPASPALPAPPPIVITFDDGGVSAIVAAEALERHGFIGHFFVTTNYIGTPGFVSEADIRDLSGRGHVVGSHSCSHPLRMGHCAWPQLVDEWTRSRSTLSDILGADVDAASVPGGDFAPQVAEAAAKAGFTRLFTSEPTLEARNAFGLTLHGRFTIQRWTTAETAAALAGGQWLSCARQALVWNAKKISKRIGGERYLQLRKLLLGHGNEVRWGDQGIRD
jgi:peptidoglycan/xylan/chitin deacetylase (PgdA/CDA1 family)